MTQIEEIMCNFDFDRVEKAMIALDWKWGLPGEVPELCEIKEHAIERMKTAIDIGGGASSGGLRAIYEEGMLTLTFVLEEWTSEDC